MELVEKVLVWFVSVRQLLSPLWFIYQVKAFCDVDENKIQKGFYTYEESKVRSTTVDTKYNRFTVIVM